MKARFILQSNLVWIILSFHWDATIVLRWKVYRIGCLFLLRHTILLISNLFIYKPAFYFRNLLMTWQWITPLFQDNIIYVNYAFISIAGFARREETCHVYISRVFVHPTSSLPSLLSFHKAVRGSCTCYYYGYILISTPIPPHVISQWSMVSYCFLEHWNIAY